MTITKLIAVVGKIIPDHEVFQHVLNHDEDFCKDIKECLCEDGTIEWQQFLDFLGSGAPDDNDSNKWSEEVYGEMFSTYCDRLYELRDRQWILESGAELDILRITHDVDESTPFVVGRIIESFEDVIPEIDTEDVVRAHSELNEEGWAHTKIYIIQDDCACCS